MVIALNMRKLHVRHLSLVAAAVIAASPAHAGDQPAAQMPATAQPHVQMPGAEQIVILIRTTLLTLNDALATGNFTVLRDQAAPSFRGPNTAAKLSRIFRNLGERRIDLAGVAMAAPELSAGPMIDANRRLHLEGHFRLQQAAVNFGLIFEMSHGRWRLFGISVNPTHPAPALAKAKMAKPTWGATVSSR